MKTMTSIDEFSNWLEGKRRQSQPPEMAEKVADIIKQVRDGGDDTLLELTERFDGVRPPQLRVPDEVIQAAAANLDEDIRQAVEPAATHIRAFHQRQLPEGFTLIQPDGTRAAWQYRSLGRVGAYVPGGRYPLVSTTLMTVIPAQVAGVGAVAVASPPTETGWPHKTILAVCGLLGVDAVYTMGGAQAVAALAYGTETVMAVDKVVGPGNVWVVAAKKQVEGQVGIDMLAGPTEVAILADDSARAEIVAADLISQAEHDPKAWPVLITTGESLAKGVEEIINHQLSQLPTEEIARQSLGSQGGVLILPTLEECVAAVNAMAPEHLSLMVQDAADWAPSLVAGAIFVGQSTPVAWGDYWAGPNHTLPTLGQARWRGPLTATDFLVPYSVIEAGPDALRASGQLVQRLAQLEGLAGHALSVEVRRG